MSKINTTDLPNLARAVATSEQERRDPSVVTLGQLAVLVDEAEEGLDALRDEITDLAAMLEAGGASEGSIRELRDRVLVAVGPLLLEA